MSNPPLGDEIARYEFWKKNLEGYALMGAMVHAAATCLAMRDAEISRLTSLLGSSRESHPREEESREVPEKKYTKPLGVYDSGFGDARMCKCGHPYSRHFDPYDDEYDETNYGAAGCKYCQSCGCEGSNENPSGFVDASGHQGYLPRNPDGDINNCQLAYTGHQVHPEFGPCQMCGGDCPDRKKFLEP